MAPDAAPHPLTAEQSAQAEALYRYLLMQRRSGVREVLIRLDDEWGVRAVGQRMNLGELTKRARMTSATN